MDGTLYTLVTLVLLCAFLFMAYQFYVGVEKSNILYLGPGNKKKIVSGKNAQPSIYANEYSFSTFIYIDNDTHNGSTDPIIFYKGKPENKHLDVKLDKSVNKFIVTYNGQDCSVEMVPIGRWFHFATVLRDQSVDVYIDAKLKKHCYFSENPRDIDVSEEIVINPHESVKLAKLKYFSRALSSSEVNDIKDAGPTTGVTDALTEMLKGLLVEDEDSKDLEEIAKQKCSAINKKNL